ncbi:dihydrofolate reductase family protein [Salinispora tropica]|uniref:dihydrofolate reductase family protein n=1 Tax=Salinispora tropica TaxID=168695 RepID=UPI000491451A|nr:dihydrofolate reductase family protein [Salinispora tropica]
MRTLIVVSAVSMDGFYEGPGSGVTVPMENCFGTYNLERIQAADTVLLGANSYAMFSGYWPGVADDSSAFEADREFSKIYNRVDKVVVSDHASPLPAEHPWADNTRIISRADAPTEIAKLKEQDGREIVTWASRATWNGLLQHDLIDEIHVLLGPAAIAGGTPLFERPVSLRRLGVRTFDNADTVLLQYGVGQPSEQR